MPSMDISQFILKTFGSVKAQNSHTISVLKLALRWVLLFRSASIKFIILRPLACWIGRMVIGTFRDRDMETSVHVSMNASESIDCSKALHADWLMIFCDCANDLISTAWRLFYIIRSQVSRFSWLHLELRHTNLGHSSKRFDMNFFYELIRIYRTRSRF